tara:strand:+ start:1555 stop:2655 length:1101 start_codon:yes stop_codon:yes gene_type:complete
MATISQATLEIYIYTGVAGQLPSTPQYTLTKSKLNSQDIIIFEVSELIKDYIDINFTGDYENIIQNVWVDFKTTRTFTFSDNSTATDANPLEKRVLAFSAYGDFKDGINPSLSNTFLASNTNFYVKKGEKAYVPVYVSTDGVYKVEYFQGSTSLVAYTIGGSIKEIRTDTTEIRSDTNVYRADIVSLRTPDSTKFQRQTEVPINSDKVTITSPDGSTETRFIKSIEECKHTPFKISFLNKFGVIQDLWFFKRRDDTFESERETYKRSIIDIGTTGVSFSAQGHSRQTIDVRATQKIRLNTGFVTEDHNEVIKQLMVTEHCYIHEDSKVIPIVPITNSFNEKKEVNEKLINFTVEFELANNYIQDIR